MYICLLKTHTSISRSFTLDKNQSRYSSLGRRGRLRPRAAVSSTSGDRGGLRERPHLPKAVRFRPCSVCRHLLWRQRWYPGPPQSFLETRKTNYKVYIEIFKKQ